MTLYSLNGGTPAALPDTIWIDGRPRTSQEPFTPEEIAAAGFVAAPAKPSHNPATQHAPVWESGAWVVRDKTANELQAEFDAAKTQAMRRIVDHINSITASALTAYPQAEVESWPIQKAEAEAVLAADAQAPCELATIALAPFLASVCEAQFGPADGATRLAQLVEKAEQVKANADTWAGMAAYVNGLRARTQLAIAAASDVSGVDAALAAGIAEGEAFKEANGL